MRDNSNATSPRSRQALLSALPQRVSPQEQDAINGIIEKISSAVDGTDMHELTQALALFLIHIVQDAYELSQRDAVDFTADCIRRYGQTVLS
jgi:hypothetical protein